MSLEGLVQENDLSSNDSSQIQQTHTSTSHNEPESLHEGSRISSVPTSGVSSRKSSVSSIDARVDDLGDNSALHIIFQKYIQIVMTHFDTRFDRLEQVISQRVNKLEETVERLSINQSGSPRPRNASDGTSNDTYYGASSSGDNKSSNSPLLQLKRDSSRMSTISNGSVHLAIPTEETTPTHERKKGTSDEVTKTMNVDVQVGNVHKCRTINAYSVYCITLAQVMDSLCL